MADEAIMAESFTAQLGVLRRLANRLDRAETIIGELRDRLTATNRAIDELEDRVATLEGAAAGERQGEEWTARLFELVQAVSDSESGQYWEFSDAVRKLIAFWREGMPS